VSILMALGALVLILAIGGRKLWTSGHYHGLTGGMVIGYGHGERDGYARGYSQAALATPNEATHYAGIVGQLPGAEDSAAFWEAVRTEGLDKEVPF
jgi:hypothetical protein